MVDVVKIEGLRELERTLQELPKATARNVLRRALTKVAKTVQADMEARAPRETGFLADSIGVSSTLNAANRSEQKKEGKAFAEVYVGSRRGSAAQLQEYGTVHHPAQPYLRPAWEANKDEAVRTMAEELKAELDKAIARRAKKLGL